MHTRRSRVTAIMVTAIIDYMEREHPYDTPSVIVMPITDGDPAYMQSVRDRAKTPK